MIFNSRRGLIRIFTIFPITALMFLLSCATVQQLANIRKPDLNVKDVRITGLDLTKVDLAFDVQIDNPNSLSATLAGFDYDFLLNEESFLKGKQDKEMVIEAKGESIMEVPLSLNFQDLYNTYQKLKDHDSTAYTMNFGLDFNLPVLGLTHVPVSHSGYLPLIKIPSLSVKYLRLNKLNLTGANLELQLGVNNPNAFSFLLQNFKYNFAVNGQTWAEGLSQKKMSIDEKGESTISIPVSLNFLQMGQTAYQVLSGNNKIDYNFNGNLDLQSSLSLLGDVSLPISKTGEVKVVR
jgi:LEA14-like dessication related protein